MSTETEFLLWLRRPEKSVVESFQFALKAWQSAEFNLSSKYEVIIKWLVEQKEALRAVERFPHEEFAELLQLRAQPCWVTHQTKLEFVHLLINLDDTKTTTTRSFAQMLQLLCEFELMQDLYRSDYAEQMKIFGKLFKTYVNYLSSLRAEQFQLTDESEFMAKTMTSLKDSAKRAGNMAAFEKAYTATTVEPLVEVLLLLERFGVNFYEDFYSLEIQLTQEMSDNDLLDRPAEKPLHVKLLMLESSTINRRGVMPFLHQLLVRTFRNKADLDPVQLCVAAYTLEILHKHEINLNFLEIYHMPALDYVGVEIFARIEAGKQSYLRECLMLLCSALRFNPLILEKNIFQYTTWMIVAPKNAQTQTVFEEFLMLLMDMFRRLSRSEKLVANLLRSLKEWLDNFTLPVASRKSKRKDSDLEGEQKSKRKRHEAENDDESETSTQRVQSVQHNKYVDMIFEKVYNQLERAQDTTTDTTSAIYSICQSFPLLDTTWPSRSVGLSFARLITGLMTKPSLVIWKTLLYALQEQLAALKEHSQISENELFLIDYQTALLSEYFVGCRITEQYNKFTKEVNELLGQTKELLRQFGQFILSHEHNPRVMNAFLECVYYASNFQLLLAYYKPDGCDKDSLEPEKVTLELHAFLQPQEWTLIEQRVLNFGRSNCKFLLNRLLLQRKQSEVLLMSSTTTSSPLNEGHLLDVMRQSSGGAQADFKWLLATLKRDEKLALTVQLLEQPVEMLRHVTDDLEMVELLALSVYEKMSLGLSGSKHGQHSLLLALNCDYRSLLAQPKDTNAMDKYLNELVGVVRDEAVKEVSLKKLPKDNCVEQGLEVLQQLPLGSLRRQWKLLVLIQQMAVYRDLKKFDELNAKALDILKDMLHFGHKIAVFKYFSIDSIVQLFPMATCWPLYEYIFGNIRNEDKGLEPFLTGLEQYFSKSLGEQSKLPKDQCRLLMLAIERLGGIVGAEAKRMKKYLSGILEIYGKHINEQFKEVTDAHESQEKHRKFVERTLAGFSHYAKAKLNATGEDEALDENFRRICKIYIGHSMDYRNPQAVRLMQVALNQRKQLHLDQDEIEFALSGYWRQLLADIRNANPIDLKNAELVVKMIIDYKTNEDFLLTMSGIGSEVKENEFLNVLKLLTLIAKCPFSIVKGAIFNEHFKKITSGIFRRLTKCDESNTDLVVALLKAQQTIVENKMVPLSCDTMDSVLAFLIDINLKKFPLNDNNLKTFSLLHQSMTDLCTALIKHRHILLMDRVPQFMQIFKDLLQSVVWYKSDRQRGSDLTPDELNDITELAIKLEALMHVIAAHGVSIKRVAPFVLTYAINLMVANKRATTLYPKIKTHVEGICYDLIGICDHRVGRFILRCSNEAASQVYETMLRDHKKYYKFKGKV